MNGAIAFAGAAAWLPLLAGLAAKATLVLLLAAAVSAALWRASAAARHLVWCVAVAGVLALPVLSAALPAWEVPLLPASSAASSANPVDIPPPELLKAPPAAPIAAPQVEGGASASRAALLPRLVAWTAAAGVLAGLLWLAAGFWGVSRLGRRAELVRDPEWLRIAHDAAERLGLRRPVLLLRTRGPLMPATWGLLWPSVVLPAAADQWPVERRHAVLAHELAHVKRFDCLTQAVAQLACVLFWWHPAVWYAARRLRVERERACDDLVLGSGARASDYAAHLLEVARGHRSLRVAAPAMVSMAKPSHLESRLLWVLDAARPRTVPSFGATLLTVLAALLVVGPLSAMRPTAAHPAVAQDHLATLDAPASADDSGKQKSSADKKLGMGGASAGSVAQADTPVGPRRGGWNDLTPDELIGLRSVGVTPAWLDEMRRSGYPDLSVKEAAGMRAVGVNAAYVQELAAEGHRGLPAERIAGLRAVGVTGAYLREVRALGYSDLSLQDIEGLRAVGVNSRYVQEMRGAGLDRLDAETVTELRAVGVTAAWIAEMRAAGLQRLDAETLAELRAVGVTGEYIAGLRAAGLRGLDERTLAELASVGVTGAYVREMHAAGLTSLTNRRLAELRAHGVNAEYIRQMEAAGFRSLSPDELIRLRTSGVERELAESYRRSGSRP